MTIVKRKRKLRLYVHITRSTMLAKTFLQGTVPGKEEGEKAMGRQYEEKLVIERQLNSDNRQEWKEMVNRSYVVRSKRLRDR